MSKLRLGGAALNQHPLNWENNVKNIKNALQQARENNIDILCLPELCITGYGCEDVFLGDWIYEKSLECLGDIIPHCQDIFVAIGLPIKYSGINYNASCLVYDKKILGFYVKQNLARDGVHYEPRWFIPWEVGREETIEVLGQNCPIGDIIIDHKGAKIGFEICEDAWRQDRPACRLYEKGVNLILNPSASHFAFGKTLLREELIVSSSKNFECTYLYANLLGNEAGRMIYDGEILLARHGQLVNRNRWLSFKQVNLIFSDIDFNNDQESYPAPPEYDRSKNTEFAQASALALFDYLRKSRSRGFVLSLSGGADSSSIAILVSEMVKRGIKELGIEGFILKTGLSLLVEAGIPDEEAVMSILHQLLSCAYQGTVNSSSSTLNSAKALADDIGAKFYHWNIDEEVDSYTTKMEEALGRKLAWTTDDIALQNIQARSRSPIIWMMANIKNSLLLTTSNRSEGDVGYATMDGDTSGSIAPIAAVDKYFIIQWLKWAEETLGYVSLSYVNALQPSAELRPLEQTQTDEDDLMPYSIIVEIEKLAIAEYRPPVEVYQSLLKKNLEPSDLLKAHIIKFFTLWSRNQWKRERIAPAFHLDEFNVDPRTWCRFPILSSGFRDELEALKKL